MPEEQLSVDVPYGPTNDGNLLSQPTASLEPGTYEIAEFEPALALTLGEGWSLETRAGAHYMLLERTAQGAATLSVQRPTLVVAADESTVPPFPDLPAALRSVAGVREVQELGPDVVAGFPARVFALSMGPLPNDFSNACEGFSACVRSFERSEGRLPDRFAYVLVADWVYRLWLVEAPDPFLVILESPPQNFEAFMSIGEPVVRSLAPV